MSALPDCRLSDLATFEPLPLFRSLPQSGCPYRRQRKPNMRLRDQVHDDALPDAQNTSPFRPIVELTTTSSELGSEISFVLPFSLQITLRLQRPEMIS